MVFQIISIGIDQAHDPDLCDCAVQPQLLAGAFTAIARLTLLRELTIGNWDPDSQHGDDGPAEAAEALASLESLRHLTALRLKLVPGSAVASLPTS